MQIFKNHDKKLTLIKEKTFKLEREIQSLFEENLEQIANLKFIKSEFKIQDYRIDTLAYDEEVKAFVIIEYKRDRNFSVIDQGMAYLNLMLSFKADFIIEYNENCQSDLQRKDIDWSQSKVIFVSPAFTNHQKQSSNFKDLPIELWEIKQFENNLLYINTIKKTKAAPNLKISQKENSTLAQVSKEIIVYDEDYHLKDLSEDILELYESFKNAILALSPNLELYPKKFYLAFKENEKNIISIRIQKKSLKLYINAKKGKLDDAKALAKDVSNVGHWATGDYEITLSDTENLEYIMSLVKQVL